MAEHEIERASTTDGLPVSPSMGPALMAANVPAQATLVDRRVVLICAVSILIAVAAAVTARILIHLIGLITNISFFGRFSLDIARANPAQNHLGLWVLGIPVIGGMIVGLMARYGSAAIRRHGIPEARHAPGLFDR